MAKKTDETTLEQPPTTPPVVESVEDLDAQIAQHEAALADLRARKAKASIQRFPKHCYKAEDTVEASRAGAREVDTAQAESDAMAEGYVYDAPTAKDGK